MDILRLPQYEVRNVTEGTQDYQISIRLIQQPQACPICYNRAIVRNGQKTIGIMDLPIYGNRTELLVIRQYYLCRNCGKNSTPDLPSVHSKRRVTQRFFDYVVQLSLIRTFTALAEETGVDKKTIRNCFDNYIELLPSTKIPTPTWLGIDKIYLSRSHSILTNVEANTVLDLLSDCTKKRLVGYLDRLADRQKIELVAIDMWQPYADAVAYCLPQAEVVIDKFHVLRLANLAVETVRKQLRENLTPDQSKALKRERFVLLKRFDSLNVTEQINLQVWSDTFPMLGQAYQLKESLHDSWCLPQTSQTALQTYQDWHAQIPLGLQFAFSDLTRAITNWQEPIFRYFDTGITNAYTESLNTLVHVSDRVERGYSFEVLRVKILYGTQIQQRGRHHELQELSEGVPIREIPDLLDP